MQEQFLPNFKAITSNEFDQPEAVERLEILFGRHAQVSEHLRELSAEHASVQPLGEDDWHELKSQVVNLRHEVEDYKQTFAFAPQTSFFVFDAEMTLNFLTLET